MRGARSLFSISMCLLFLTSCTANALFGRYLSSVMSECESRHSEFSAIASCTRSTYDLDGRRPRSGSVQAFYAMMAEIGAAYQSEVITNTEAKAAWHGAYMQTVGASNRRATASAVSSALTTYQKGVVLQQQNTQKWIDSTRKGFSIHKTR